MPNLGSPEVIIIALVVLPPEALRGCRSTDRPRHLTFALIGRPLRIREQQVRQLIVLDSFRRPSAS